MYTLILHVMHIGLLECDGHYAIHTYSDTKTNEVFDVPKIFCLKQQFLPHLVAFINYFSCCYETVNKRQLK